MTKMRWKISLLIICILCFTLFMPLNSVFAAPDEGATTTTEDTADESATTENTSDDANNDVAKTVAKVQSDTIKAAQDSVAKISMNAINKANETQERNNGGLREQAQGSNVTTTDYSTSLLTGNIDSKIKISKKLYTFTIFEQTGINLIPVTVADAINALSNMFFGMAKAWMGFVAKITGWALDGQLMNKWQSNTIQLVSKFAGDSQVFSGSREGLSGLIWLGVVLSVGLIILMFARRQTSGALGMVLKIALVLAMIAGYMALPNKFMSILDSVVQGVGTDILSSQEKETPNETAKRKIWLVGIDQPWQELEFGDIKVSVEKGGMLEASSSYPEAWKWFTTAPSEREGLTNSDGKELRPGETGDTTKNDFGEQATRLGEVFIIFIIDIIIGGLIVIVAGIGIGFQIGSLVMWIMGFFVLIISLFPTHGMNKIKEWFGVLAMTYFGQIVVYIVLCLILQIMTWFFTSFGDVFQAFGMMIGLAIGVKIMYKPIMQLFSGGGGLREAGGGGVADMATGIKDRVAGGTYRGDSTQRLLPSPIRSKIEAKRMAKREQDIEDYREKAAQKKVNKEIQAEARAEAKEQRAVQKAQARLAKDEQREERRQQREERRQDTTRLSNAVRNHTSARVRSIDQRVSSKADTAASYARESGRRAADAGRTAVETVSNSAPVQASRRVVTEVKETAGKAVDTVNRQVEKTTTAINNSTNNINQRTAERESAHEKTKTIREDTWRTRRTDKDK